MSNEPKDKVIPRLTSDEVANSFQEQLKRAIENAPPLLRQKIYADIEAEIKKQRALSVDQTPVCDAKQICEIQYSTFRHCAQLVNEPDKFHVAWLQMMCCSIMLYEDMTEIVSAVTDATASAAPEGSIIITPKTKQPE